jgi:hypothetical protein
MKATANGNFRRRFARAGRAYLKNNLIIAGLGLAVVAGLSVGYATLNTTPGISGTAKVRATVKSPIRISAVTTDWTTVSNCGYDNAAPAFTDNTFTISGHFSSGCLNGYAYVYISVTITNDSSSPITYKGYTKTIDTETDAGHEVYVTTGLPANTVFAANSSATYKFDMITVPLNPPNASDFIFQLMFSFDAATPPVIVVSDGKYSYTAKAGTAVDFDAKIKAVDDQDGDLTAKLTKSCTKNGAGIACPTDKFVSSTPGTYKVTYNVSNSVGMDAAPVTIMVILT